MGNAVRGCRDSKHEALLQIARNVQDGEVPEIFYHRKLSQCIYHQERFRVAQKKRALEEDAHEDETVLERPRKRSATSASRVYYKECIFCERLKYVNRTLEKLVKATQLRVDQTLRKIATERCDERILAITSRDIDAAEVHYHRTCYRDYTRPTHQQHPEESEPKNDAEYDAFSDLFSFIRTDVLNSQVVITMNEFTKKLESFLQSRGTEKLRELTKKHLRKKIESEFGSTLEIFPDEMEKLLVIPANLDIKETEKKMVNLEKEVMSVESQATELERIFDQSAEHLRNVILDMKWTMPCPILPSDLSVGQFPVPECLRPFLMGLLTSNRDVKNPSPRVKMLLEYFSQDIIYAVTDGRTKPPKQILLLFGVKTLTGNVELTRMLNRFGHGVSYSQLEEMPYVSKNSLLTSIRLQYCQEPFNDTFLPI